MVVTFQAGGEKDLLRGSVCVGTVRVKQRELDRCWPAQFAGQHHEGSKFGEWTAVPRVATVAEQAAVELVQTKRSRFAVAADARFVCNLGQRDHAATDAGGNCRAVF